MAGRFLPGLITGFSHTFFGIPWPDFINTGLIVQDGNIYSPYFYELITDTTDDVYYLADASKTTLPRFIPKSQTAHYDIGSPISFDESFYSDGTYFYIKDTSTSTAPQFYRFPKSNIEGGIQALTVNGSSLIGAIDISVINSGFLIGHGANLNIGTPTANNFIVLDLGAYNASGYTLFLTDPYLSQNAATVKGLCVVNGWLVLGGFNTPPSNFNILKLPMTQLATMQTWIDARLGDATYANYVTTLPVRVGQAISDATNAYFSPNRLQHSGEQSFDRHFVRFTPQPGTGSDTFLSVSYTDDTNIYDLHVGNVTGNNPVIWQDATYIYTLANQAPDLDGNSVPYISRRFKTSMASAGGFSLGNVYAQGTDLDPFNGATDGTYHYISGTLNGFFGADPDNSGWVMRIKQDFSSWVMAGPGRTGFGL